MYSIVKLKLIGGRTSNREEEKLPGKFQTYEEAVKWVTSNTALFEADFTKSIPIVYTWRIIFGE